MNLFKIATATVVIFLLAGCAGKPISFKSADPKSYENVKNQGRQITSSAGGFQLLLFIPIDINDRHERAYNLLLAQAGGDTVTNIKIEESWSWALVGTIYTTKLTATAYPRQNSSVPENDNSIAGEIKKLNDLLEKKLITQEEYALAKQKVLSK